MAKYHLALSIFLLSCFGMNAQSSFQINAVKDSVEIIVDRWGIPHIYAKNEADLFFAQGFQAAKDRLFQFEIWRRQATGTVAELLGERELKRDIGARLFQFRGDMKQELQYYHPRGELIINAFVAGINAYIDWTEQNPGSLPLEFRLLNTKPQKWTPEVVISRHQGLLGNITDELDAARLVALLGEEKTKELVWFHPMEPDLSINPSIPKELLFEDVLGLYNAYRGSLNFKPEDLIGEARNTDEKGLSDRVTRSHPVTNDRMFSDRISEGSNNWVVSGALTQSGYPMMANDPHRRQSAPSLRYMAHLVAPGWNVIGGGEPVLPGISIGHNEHGAWGLTVFETDGEDLYVYDTNPENPNQYWYKGAWENMRILMDTIPVKGKSPVVVELKYTRHGPVTFEDGKRNKATAVRCAWMEIGGAPYLASLRMNQATTWEEFREACHYSHIPGENMVWVDKKGNIGWQAVGIAPIRRNFSGMVPVPGDGRFEWDGYLPIKAKPHSFNPPEGFIGTANANLTAIDYPYMDAIGFNWSEPYRHSRVQEMLASGRKHSLMDMAFYQTDYLSIPARQLVSMLKYMKTGNELTEKARTQLLNWNYEMTPNSIAAGIYNAYEGRIRQNMRNLVVPEAARRYDFLQMKKVIDWVVLPDAKFGTDPVAGRDAFLVKSLEEAVNNLTQKLGKDMNRWQYGQSAYKHALLKHPMSAAVQDSLREKLDVGPLPRGGNTFTVNNTGGSDNQPSGASFRLIVDAENWDACLGTNTPGQSGNPEHPHYRNLFELWAKDKYFPVFYSRVKVEQVVEYKHWLVPSK